MTAKPKLFAKAFAGRPLPENSHGTAREPCEGTSLRGRRTFQHLTGKVGQSKGPELKIKDRDIKWARRLKLSTPSLNLRTRSLKFRACSLNTPATALHDSDSEGDDVAS